MRKIFLKIWVLFFLLLTLCAAPYAAAGTVTYTYDDASRLIKADYGNGKVITYTYDNAGNLLQRTVTGQQPPEQFTLTVQKDGTGTGTVTSNPAGIDCGADCTQDYDENTQVTLTANANAGSVFAAWSGSGCSGTGTCTVTMDAAKTVTATFNQTQAQQYTLTVQKAGDGTGTVTSNPAGIDCGADCTQDYDENTQVTLTANANAGSVFAAWSGSGCSGTGTCTVTMDAAKTVTATFNVGHYGTLQFSSSTYTVNEDSATATITVTRADGSNGSVSVDYSTSDGTATTEEDYTASSGTLEWADGDANHKTFTVPITDDITKEDNETINLALSNPTGGSSLGTPNTAVLTIVDNDPDNDADGISDAEENGGPNGGDGDGNGTADVQEPNVATFKNINGDYCTLISPDTTELKDVAAKENPSPEDAPANMAFSAGFFQFSLSGISAGACTEVTLILPKDTEIETYYKYGQTPDNPANHWYEFLYDGETGAEIFQDEDRTRIVLHLCDGKRGDNDLDSTNGVIDDIGGPSSTASTETVSSDSDDDLCFIATAAFGSPMEPHVTILRDFRDTYLLSCSLGRLFVRAYNRYSPSMAHFIEKHETLRTAVRIGLLPLIAFSYVSLNLGVTITVTLLVIVFVLTVILSLFYRRRLWGHKLNT